MRDNSPLKPIVDYVDGLEDLNDNLVQSLSETQAQLDSYKNTERFNAVLRCALHYMGENVPYIFGAEYPEGFDCSSFIQQIFADGADIRLPRLAGAQSKTGIEVDKNDESTWQPGDLLFFKWTDGDKTIADHVVMYLQDGTMIHTAVPRSGIIVRRWKDWYPDSLLCVRRVL